MFTGHKFQGMRATLTIIVTAGLLAGCITGGKQQAGTDTMVINDPSAPAKPADRYKVTAETAAFFRYSPQQASGPDQQIKKETRVTLLSCLAGFSKVRLMGGDVGYMDSGDIGHLNAKEITDEDALYAAQHAPPPMLSSPINNANIGNGGNYNPPPEAGQAQPLPLPDAPTASPPPPSMFRY